MLLPRGIKIGDTIRLYGMTGIFRVEELEDNDGRPWEFFAVPEGAPLSGFGALTASVVEVNGAPVPCLSCPIAPPAPDYPHVPSFDYDDGPQTNADDVLSGWLSLS